MTMRKIAIATAILLLPFAAQGDETTKRAKIHHMLSIVGSDFRDGSKQLAAFESQMDEIQVDQAIAFFESDAGRQFLLASRGVQKETLKTLDETIDRSRKKRVLNELRTLDTATEGPDVPIVDPWGTPYKVIVAKGHRRLVSAGPDTQFAPDSLKPGVKSGDFGDDYIFEDGEFVKIP